MGGGGGGKMGRSLAVGKHLKHETPLPQAQNSHPSETLIQLHIKYDTGPQ